MDTKEKIKTILRSAIDFHVQGQMESAEVYVREALHLFEENFPSENDILAGNLFRTQSLEDLRVRDFLSAMKSLHKAYALNPKSREIYAELLRCYWNVGNHEEFWRLYENRRFFFKNLVTYERVFGSEKLWDGNTSLDDKVILLYGEQGMGDQIQFVRYIHLLKEKFNCHVILNCSAALNPLMEQLESVDGIVFKEHVSMDCKPEFDFHFPLMSLPHVLCQYDPFFIGGLFKPTSGKKLLFSDKKNVGFVVTANPNSFGKEHRNISASWIQNCLSSDVQFYNLHNSEKCNKHGIIDLCDHINDFGDLANYVDSMDLIITIDSALLHVAGSMGKETLALIPQRSDWKWKYEETTPWYPSVKLLHEDEDWFNAFEKVREILGIEYK